MRIFIAALLAGVAGCRREAIETRRVAKEVPAAAASMEAARPGGLHWTTPAGWKEMPGEGMRAATLVPPAAAGRAQVTVIVLPGDVGGELANVNRWRGQLSLAPLAEGDLAGARGSLSSGAGPATVYDFIGGGSPRTRLIAAVVRRGGMTWFFKLMGEEKAVAAARPAFHRMIQGLKVDAR